MANHFTGIPYFTARLVLARCVCRACASGPQRHHDSSGIRPKHITRLVRYHARPPRERAGLLVPALRPDLRGRRCEGRSLSRREQAAILRSRSHARWLSRVSSWALSTSPPRGSRRGLTCRRGSVVSRPRALRALLHRRWTPRRHGHLTRTTLQTTFVGTPRLAQQHERLPLKRVPHRAHPDPRACTG